MNMQEFMSILFNMDHHRLIHKVSVECTRNLKYKLKIEYIKRLQTTLTYRMDNSDTINPLEVFSDYTLILEAFLTPPQEVDDDEVVEIDIDKILA